MVRHLFLVSLCVSVMLPPNRQTDRPQTVRKTISQNERQSDRLLDSIQSVFMLALFCLLPGHPLLSVMWTRFRGRGLIFTVGCSGWRRAGCFLPPRWGLSRESWRAWLSLFQHRERRGKNLCSRHAWLSPPPSTRPSVVSSVLWGLLRGLKKAARVSDIFWYFSLSLSPKVTDSSMRRGDGTAGRVIDTQTLKELQTYSSQLRELAHTAADRLNQVHIGDLVYVHHIYLSIYISIISSNLLIMEKKQLFNVT